MNIGITGAGALSRTWIHGPLRLFGVNLAAEFYGAATTTLQARAVSILRGLDNFDSDTENEDVLARLAFVQTHANGGSANIFVPLYGIFVPAEVPILTAISYIGDASGEVQAVYVYEPEYTSKGE